ncbi:hypothetical protein EYR40_008007 [Pleurotus pulmonarius]|nr:hypothetical protein EYR38_007685 [Pleurotus pulmonarius]KAF4597545.1 hypothetical protein EYR40_008007 [Pleurotus pulmonarius]
MENINCTDTNHRISIMSSALDLSLGAILIGTYLSSVLFGVASVQLYVYLLSGYKDPIWTRVLVWVCWIMELLWTLAIWIYTYRIMVTFYGDLSTLTTPHWTLSVSSASNAIIGALVQAYFANRVRILSGSRILPLVVLTGALTQATATLVITGLSLHYAVDEFGRKFGWISTLAIAADLATDALNTAGLWYYLRAQNAAVLTYISSMTTIRRTDIHRL